MSEREEIRKRVDNFRKFQERLAAEREARINKVNQRILHILDEMRASPETNFGQSWKGQSLELMRLSAHAS